jgi:hypothetical protein
MNLSAAPLRSAAAGYGERSADRADQVTTVKPE